MATFIRNRQELEHLVVTMYAEGRSIRGLARHFSVSRNMVRRILRKHDFDRDQGPDQIPNKKVRASKLDPYINQIQELLKDYPRLSGQRIYEEIRTAGYEGGISILRDRLHHLRPQPKKEPAVRFETEPGLQGQMDWSPYTINFLDTGKTRINCFSYILGFSRRQFIYFTEHRDFFTLIRRHQDAFRHFNGVPRQCLYDSEKTVVLRWEAGKPIFNPSFTAFITHYQCRPVACRRGRAETKGKIERPFQYVETNLLAGRRFRNIDDLRACAAWWLENHSDTHVHDTTARPPLELFLEQEQEALLPLPSCPYDSSEVALRVCRIDGYLEFETNLYPVPYEYVTDILTMKATEEEVFIYAADLSLVVRHERLPAGAAIKLDSNGIHGARSVRYGLEPVRDQFLALGNEAGDFLQGLIEKHSKNCGFHARAILRQKETYHCDDINRALAHACRYHAYDQEAIQRILRARASPRTLESYRNEKAAAKLRQALPEIRQRSLAEYGTLFGGVSHDNQEENRQPGQDQEQSQDPET